MEDSPSPYPDPSDFAETPSAVDSPSAAISAGTEETTKRKRKAWGQPIPDFKVVLPPRKRAKTAEEKEQRKNERVIRNRKAADKSRQRQKAAVAKLEVKTNHMEAELAHLRATLNQYQSAFGVLPGTSISFSAHSQPTPSTTLLLPADVINVPTIPSLEDNISSLTTDDDASSFTTTPGPILSIDSPRLSISVHHSPPLAPTLFPAQDQLPLPEFEQQDQLPCLANFDEVSGMTQYPAAILCDLQCQPESWTETVQSREAVKRFDFSLHLINLTILLTIYETFSSTMLSPMCRIFRTLAEGLSMTSLEPDLVDSHSPLIHSLITNPTSRTTRRVFRMKLLSRLLACSPSTARLIKAATDRALQRLVDEEAIFENPEGGQRWASLLTTKWAIQCLEKEHQRYRLMVDIPKDVVEPLPSLARQIGLINKMEGVDYVAIERSLWRWRSENNTRTGVMSCVPGLDVH